jgi:hypothetical protein
VTQAPRQAPALPLLRHNLAAAAAAAPPGAPFAAAAAELAWGDAAAAAAAAASFLPGAPPVELLLGSDVVYDEALVPLLLATMRSLAGPSTRALLAVDAVRAPAALAAFLAGATHDGWRASRVPDAHLDVVVRHADIQLLVLRRGDVDAADAAAEAAAASEAAVVGDTDAGGAPAASLAAEAWRARRQGTAAARLLAGIVVPHG